MKVIATKPGYYGKLRDVGDEFDVPDGSKASWFVPVSAEQKHSDPVKKQKAATLSGDQV